MSLPVDGTSSVGHLVQSAGVPLTEVGRLLFDGAEVDPSFRPSGGEAVEVLPVPRPQPLPGGPRLLLDVHLGSLARRLRLLGVDTSYRTDAADADLASTARAEQRMLLTQDRGLLRRTAVRRTAAFVRGVGGDAQLADVLDRFELSLAPYTRCPGCNGALHPAAKGAVLQRLRAGTARTQHRFSQCSECGAVYWHGAHAARLEQIVGAALVGGPRPGSGPDGS